MILLDPLVYPGGLARAWRLQGCFSNLGGHIETDRRTERTERRSRSLAFAVDAKLSTDFVRKNPGCRGKVIPNTSFTILF